MEREADTMELAEALFHANWSSSFSALEESQTMAQLLSTCSMITREPDHDPSSGLPPLFWSDHGAESSYCSYWPQGCNDIIDPSSGGFLPHHDPECYSLGHPNVAREIHTASSVWLGFCATEDAANAASLPPSAPINEETSSEDIAAGCCSANPVEPAFLTSLKSSPKRKSRVHGQEADSAAIPRKKPRSLRKNGKDQQPKKTQKGVENDDAGESNGGPNWPDARSCSSEEVSSSSQEVHGGEANLSSMSPAASDQNGKARAGRGAATDPQSLYARKRRERINERLRILQNLVPNGTKVDISTMLEEAVQYVKFLQLQIKLLSSDELWMYAPIAYNGMDIGLDLRSSSLQ